jgi:hypothetical protein
MQLLPPYTPKVTMLIIRIRKSEGDTGSNSVLFM